MCVKCVVESLLDHDTDGVIVFDKGLSGDFAVDRMLEAGWTLETEETIAGKRIRYLLAPEE